MSTTPSLRQRLDRAYGVVPANPVPLLAYYAPGDGDDDGIITGDVTLARYLGEGYVEDLGTAASGVKHKRQFAVLRGATGVADGSIAWVEPGAPPTVRVWDFEAGSGFSLTVESGWTANGVGLVGGQLYWIEYRLPWSTHTLPVRLRRASPTLTGLITLRNDDASSGALGSIAWEQTDGGIFTDAEALVYLFGNLTEEIAETAVRMPLSGAAITQPGAGAFTENLGVATGPGQGLVAGGTVRVWDGYEDLSSWAPWATGASATIALTSDRSRAYFVSGSKAHVGLVATPGAEPLVQTGNLDKHPTLDIRPDFVAPDEEE